MTEELHLRVVTPERTLIDRKVRSVEFTEKNRAKNIEISVIFLLRPFVPIEDSPGKRLSTNLKRPCKSLKKTGLPSFILDYVRNTERIHLASVGMD